MAALDAERARRMPMDRRVGLAALVSAAFLSLLVGIARAADEPIPGRIGIVRPMGYAKFVAVTPASMPFDPPGVGDDPTILGGSLRIFDTGSAGGDHTYALPAANWSPRSTPGEFKYERSVFSDPVRYVLVRGRVIRAVVQRQGPDWTPPFSGDMAVVLTIGASTRYCLLFGGETLANSPRRLRRRFAPAPPTCASTSGAFLEESRGGLFD
jgi:hypothetical protein